MRAARLMGYAAVIVAVAGGASAGYIVKAGTDTDAGVLFYLETISLGALPYFGLAALLWLGSMYLSRDRRAMGEEAAVWSANPWMPLTGRERVWRALRPDRAKRPQGPWAYDRRRVHLSSAEPSDEPMAED